MRLLLFFFFSLLLVLPGRAQERVRNVRMRVVDSSQLEIRYDLIEIRPGDSVYVQIESRLRGKLPLLPEYVRGDLGKLVTAGSDRRIVWDALANEYSLNEDIRATIIVKTGPPITPDQPASAAAPKPTVTPTKPVPTEPVAIIQPKPADSETPVAPAPATSSPPQRPQPLTGPVETDRATTPTDSVRLRRTRYAGPAWALLSVVAPGIGNIFVQRPKPKVGLRPLLTVGCYGLALFGLTERQKSRDEYALYEQQKNMTAGEPYYQRANSHHQAYYGATRGALVVAAADVILTFMKGLRNSRLQQNSQRAQPVTLRPGVQAGQPTAVVHFSF